MDLEADLDAINNIVDADYPFWSVELRMSYPLGQSADKAAYERARLQLQQAQAQIRQIELQVAVEVTNAALQIDAIQQQIEAATASCELAEEQFRAAPRRASSRSAVHQLLRRAGSSCRRSAIW